MLQHSRDPAWKPARVVVLGAGFVGGAIVDALGKAGIPNLSLGRREIDLLEPDASDALAKMLKPDDTLVVISALAPCKTLDMMRDNIQMMQAVGNAIAKRPVDHLLYISSDAVYADSSGRLSETSCAEPGSLHGAMHLAREIMLRHVAGETPLAILRPTLIYGARDPHNGYGPNQFSRKAARGEPLVLFGEGEERRDHVLVDDVAALALLAIRRRSSGTLNVATGVVTSFRDIAERVASAHSPQPPVQGTPRKGPMPHNGYRAFDIAACRTAFPEFQFTSLADGIKSLPVGDPTPRAN